MRTKDWEVEIMGKVTDTEKLYVEDPSPDNLAKWTEVQQLYRILSLKKAENREHSEASTI